MVDLREEANMEEVICALDEPSKQRTTNTGAMIGHHTASGSHNTAEPVCNAMPYRTYQVVGSALEACTGAKRNTPDRYDRSIRKHPPWSSDHARDAKLTPLYIITLAPPLSGVVAHQPSTNPRGHISYLLRRTSAWDSTQVERTALMHEYVARRLYIYCCVTTVKATTQQRPLHAAQYNDHTHPHPQSRPRIFDNTADPSKNTGSVIHTIPASPFKPGVAG